MRIRRRSFGFGVPVNVAILCALVAVVLAAAQRCAIADPAADAAAAAAAAAASAAAAQPLPQPAVPVPAPALAASRPVMALQIARRTPPADEFVDDAQIGQAIQKAQTYLMGLFNGPKLKGFDASKQLIGAGAYAHVVYALLQSGLATQRPELDPKTPRVKAMLASLKAMPILPAARSGTYTRAFRIMALTMLHRPEDAAAIKADTEALLDSCRQGAYTYGTRNDTLSKRPWLAPLNNLEWDNSNSQYGLLGVWCAAEAGAEIPTDYWGAVEEYWTKAEMPDGQWGYSAKHPEDRFSMAMAAVASLMVCHDYLDVAKGGAAMDVGREPFSPALEKGLAVLENDNLNSVVGGYNHYGLERIGLASGFKYIGANDWYRTIATQLVKTQRPDGSWEKAGRFDNDLSETAYDLLFLSRGRHPILMNKLRFEHFWDNRPHDVANLARYASHDMEAVFNWQVVTLQHEWSDLADAPVLYMASHKVPVLADADYAKLRSFIYAGGLLLTQADGGSAEFNDYVEKVMVKKVLGDYEMTPLPETHVLYSLNGQMALKPPLKMVSNGARLLWIHSEQDISQYWQQRAFKTHPEALQLGLNLCIYASGKSDFRNRLAAKVIPTAPPAAPANTIRIARVKYPLPSWDPEPYAWTNFANQLNWDTSIGIAPETVNMENLATISPAQTPLAHLTGSNPFTPTDAQCQSLNQFVSNGGILLADSCGGSSFNDSLEKLIARAFPGAVPQKLAPGHPLAGATFEGMSDLSKMTLRPYAAFLLGQNKAAIYVLKVGRGQVIYTPLDLTSGLLGTRTWEIVGYDAPSCQQFMRNLIIWVGHGAP